MTTAPARPEVFTRKASGLVRVMSPYSAFAYNILTMGLIFPWTYLWAPGALPGGSLVWGIIIATVLEIPIALAYVWLSTALPRSGGDPKVPPLLVARLFQARTGSAVYARGSDGFAVAQLKEVMPPDPAKEPDGIKLLSEQLVPAMQDDLLQEYDRALRNRFPVSVNQAAVARAF